MKIKISSITAAARIRKDVRNIGALAQDIRENGLICPIAVMPGGEGFRLLAGLRRLRAMELNGETEIKANVFPASDAEAALKIEFSENEQREPFTYSEKMDYARLIEEIEKAKALERKIAGVKISDSDLPLARSEGQKGETREVVGSKIGMSGAQYERAKYVAKTASPEIIDQLDRGERTVYGTYKELRDKEKAATPEISAPPKSRKKPTDYEKLQIEYDALKTKHDETIGKYANAEHKREMLETQLYNTNLQWDCERDGKNSRIAELSEALESAHVRISELETELMAAMAKIIELEAKS